MLYVLPGEIIYDNNILQSVKKIVKLEEKVLLLL